MFYLFILFSKIDYLPPDSIREGMKGYGVTVFHGTRIDTFGVEILGVIKRDVSGKSLIIARLYGEPVEFSGILAGMSGSPVYINGKLIGALAYAWAFSKIPICGITPVENMLEGKGEGAGVPELETMPSVLSITGFSEEVTKKFEEVFKEYSMIPVLTGYAEKTAPLKPGGVVGALLMDGDGRVAAMGTITFIDGKKLYAFGHPLFLSGECEIPMTDGYVHAYLPSIYHSFKLSSPGRIIGTLVEDRDGAVVGILGKNPRMIPLVVSDGKVKKQYKICRVPWLFPRLAGVAVFNLVLEKTGFDGEFTAKMKMRFTVKGKPIELEWYETGKNMPGLAYGDVDDALSEVVMNPYKPVFPDSVKVEFSLEKGIRKREILSLQLPRKEFEPGEKMEVILRMREYGKGIVVRKIKVKAPSLPGEYTLRVSGGREDFEFERSRVPGNYQTETLEDLLRVLSKIPQGDELVLKICSNRTVLSGKGKEFSSLPPSFTHLLSSSPYILKGKGELVTSHVEHTGYVITGEKSVNFRVRRK